jgi:hypothetical protein
VAHCRPNAGDCLHRRSGTSTAETDLQRRAGRSSDPARATGRATATALPLYPEDAADGCVIISTTKAVLCRKRLTQACCEARRRPTAREQSFSRQENEPASTVTIGRFTMGYRVQLNNSLRGLATARGIKSRAPQNVRKLWDGPIWNRTDP